jgi:hypothetical protein
VEKRARFLKSLSNFNKCIRGEREKDDWVNHMRASVFYYKILFKNCYLNFRDVEIRQN